MRKPIYLPIEEQCHCGCGYPKRPNSKYASDRCRERVWERKNPKAVAKRRAAEKTAREKRNTNARHVCGPDCSYRFGFCIPAYLQAQRDRRNGKATAPAGTPQDAAERLD